MAQGEGGINGKNRKRQGNERKKNDQISSSIKCISTLTFIFCHCECRWRWYFRNHQCPFNETTLVLYCCKVRVHHPVYNAIGSAHSSTSNLIAPVSTFRTLDDEDVWTSLCACIPAEFDDPDLAWSMDKKSTSNQTRLFPNRDNPSPVWRGTARIKIRRRSLVRGRTTTIDRERTDERPVCRGQKSL